MSLVGKTIAVLDDTSIDDCTMLEYVFRLRDPQYGSWSFDAIQRVMSALVAASKEIPKQELIDEYNVLADYHGCDRIDYWDSEASEMELEIFIDEVLEAIEQEMMCQGSINGASAFP